MKVYVEYVIIDNMVIDGLLLYLSCVTLKIKANAVRIFLSAFTGTVSAVFLSLVSIPVYIGLPVKIALGVIMAFIAVGKNKPLRYFLIFGAYSFITGGLILALLFMLKKDVFGALTFNYSAGVPVGIIAGGAWLSVIIGVRAAKLLYRTKARSKADFVPVRLIWDKEYSLTGFKDSGNLLTHEGLPVFFAVSKRLKALTVSKYAENLLHGGENNARIELTTVAGNSVCLAVKTEKLYVDGEKTQCFLAFGKICSEDFDVIVK